MSSKISQCVGCLSSSPTQRLRAFKCLRNGVFMCMHVDFRLTELTLRLYRSTGTTGSRGTNLVMRLFPHRPEMWCALACVVQKYQTSSSDDIAQIQACQTRRAAGWTAVHLSTGHIAATVLALGPFLQITHFTLVQRSLSFYLLTDCNLLCTFKH